MPMLIMITSVVCLYGSFADSAEPTERPLCVYVSIPPQKYFVERVGGEYVDVSALLPPGQSPATYEMTPKQMVGLGKARVLFRIGVPFEKQVVAKIGATLTDLNIVDTRKGIDLRLMASPHHDESCDHEHDAQDPHIWMNPRLAKVQARIICEELSRLDPAHKEAYEKNLRAFEADLDRVDATIAAKLAPLQGREFFVFHPAYGYFADAYGLTQVAVQAGGKTPTAKQLGALIRQAKEAGVKLIFVQPQFDKSSAKAVAEAIGGVVTPMDPLAESYLNNLLEMADKIEKALTGSTIPAKDKP